MTDSGEVHVTLAPRRPPAILLSAPDLRSALNRVRAGNEPDATRVAIWTDAPPPEQGADVVVCAPVAQFENRRAQAEQAVERWDDVWLLIESMPRAQRDAARQHLVDVISIALLAAAIEGVEEEEEDVGF